MDWINKLQDDNAKAEALKLLNANKDLTNELATSKDALTKVIDENKSLRDSNAMLYAQAVIGTTDDKKKKVEEVDEIEAYDNIADLIKNAHKNKED